MLVASDALRPTITKVFACDEIVEAHRYLDGADAQDCRDGLTMTRAKQLGGQLSPHASGE